MNLKFHLSVYFVPLRPLSRVASDYSSGSVVWNGILRPLRPLREIKIRTIVYSGKENIRVVAICLTQRTQRAQSFVSLCVSRWRWSGRKLCYDKSAQRVLFHPLPPTGYSPLSQGESLLQQNITAPADCPPETGGTRSVATEGVDSFHFFVH